MRKCLVMVLPISRQNFSRSCTHCTSSKMITRCLWCLAFYRKKMKLLITKCELSSKIYAWIWPTTSLISQYSLLTSNKLLTTSYAIIFRIADSEIADFILANVGGVTVKKTVFWGNTMKMKTLFTGGIWGNFLDFHFCHQTMFLMHLSHWFLKTQILLNMGKNCNFYSTIFTSGHFFQNIMISALSITCRSTTYTQIANSRPTYGLINQMAAVRQQIVQKTSIATITQTFIIRIQVFIMS